MDIARINKSVVLDYDDAMNLMTHGGAITDGEWVYGETDVVTLDKYSVAYICQYPEWDQVPVGFTLYDNFDEVFNKSEEWHPYMIPKTAKQAVDLMREAYVVEDIEDARHPMYFIRTMTHPFIGKLEYVFRLYSKDDLPELIGLVGDWEEKHVGPIFEVVED